MDTHEFQFPGGSAVITTTTGGTQGAPDFCVRPEPLRGHQAISPASVFAAEILKLASRVEELETALAAAGEGRENMEIRLSGRIAELERENQNLKDFYLPVARPEGGTLRSDAVRLSRLDALLGSEEPPEELLARFGEGKTAPFVAWRWFRDFLRGPIDDPVPEVPRETDDAEEPPAAVTIGEVEEWRRRIARHGAGISDLDASDKPNLEISVIAREIPKQPIADTEGERKRLEEENTALLEILRSLEWIGPDADAEASAIWCPACDNLKEEGHTEDCRLGRALAGKAVHQDTDLLEILRYLEWSHGPSNWRVCPICRRSKADGHAADCYMGRALEGKAAHLDTGESEKTALRRLVDIASREIDRLAAQKTASDIERKRLEDELTAASALVKQIDADRTRLMNKLNDARKDAETLKCRRQGTLATVAVLEKDIAAMKERANTALRELFGDKGFVPFNAALSAVTALAMRCRVVAAENADLLAKVEELAEIENLADTALFALDGVNYKLPAVEAVKKLTDRILAGVRMRDIKAESLVEQVEKAKILNYLENCARVSQPVLAWHFRNAKTEISRGAHLEDNFTFSLPPYEVVKEQEAAEATVREALDDIVEKKLYRTPMSIANERDIKAANPVYVHQEGVFRTPDEPGVVVAASPGSVAAEYAAKQPLYVGGFNANALGKDGSDFRRQVAEPRDESSHEGMQDFRTPEFETEKLRIKKIRERAVADLRGEMQAAPWFAGLSMEEVHAQILLGKAPGSGQPGAAISVPEGFLNWLTDAHRQPGPEKAEEPRFKPLGVGGPGAWEARRRRHDAPNTISVRLTAEAERGVLGTDDLGLRGSEETIAVYGEREIIGFLETIARLRREKERLRELFHPEVRSVGEGAAGGAFRSTYREVVPGVVTIRDIQIRVPFDLDIEFTELSGKLFWRLVHAFPSEEPHGE